MARLDIAELERIRAFAYHCWGYMITQPEAMDIWRLANGLPAVLTGWPPKKHMRDMAAFHKESWPLVVAAAEKG